MAELFNFVTSHPWGAFLGGAICVIGIIGLLAVVLNQHIEAQRKQQEAERLEAERKKQEAEHLEAERKKQEAERLEAERKKQEAERLEAERQKQEAERLEAERKKQEAERLEAARKKQEAERKKQEAERLEAERKKQEAERLEAARKRLAAEEQKPKTEPISQEVKKSCEDYWKFALSEYRKLKTHKGDNASDIAARKEIAMGILKLTSGEFTKTELYEQFKQMYRTYVHPLQKENGKLSSLEQKDRDDVLRTAYEELYFHTICR